MRKFVLVLIVLAFAASANAEVVNHWSTAEQCLAAKDSPFYYPSVIKKKALGRGELVLGHPTGGCADMDLPDRLGDRGWVRIELGRKLVYGPDGVIRRLEECDNKIHAFVAFPLVAALRGEVGPQGPMGPQGPEGPRGFQGEPGRNLIPEGGYTVRRPPSWAWKNRYRILGVAVLGGGAAAYYYWCYF